LQRLVRGVALLAAVGGEEAGGIRQPLVAVGDADLLLRLPRQAAGDCSFRAGCFGTVRVHRVHVAQDALVDRPRLVEVLLVRGEELRVRGLRHAAVRSVLGYLVLPALVEPARGLAALDARSLPQLDPGAAHAERGAVLGLRPLAVRGLYRRQRDG